MPFTQNTRASDPQPAIRGQHPITKHGTVLTHSCVESIVGGLRDSTLADPRLEALAVRHHPLRGHARRSRLLVNTGAVARSHHQRQRAGVRLAVGEGGSSTVTPPSVSTMTSSRPLPSRSATIVFQMLPSASQLQSRRRARS